MRQSRVILVTPLGPRPVNKERHPANRRGAQTDGQPFRRSELLLDLRAAAIQLFVEALGIEGVRGRGDGGQSGESDERGKDRLHGQTPKCCFPKSVGEQHARAGINWVL
jgi:hypothetical protein